AGTAPRWLKLTRSGNTITGYESNDGTTWREDGTVTVVLPRTAQVGMFVTSPAALVITKIAGGTSITGAPTVGTATYDNVSVQPVAAQDPAGWRREVVGGGPDQKSGGPALGDVTEAGGTFTVTGSGDVAGYGIASFQGGGDDDIVVNSLAGVQIGLMAIVALG